MNCPVDGATLEMSERQGVEIDYCPKCRGVWLDRGELDKIIERSAAFEQEALKAAPGPDSREVARERYARGRGDDSDDGGDRDSHRSRYGRDRDDSNDRGRGFGEQGYTDRYGHGSSKKRKKESFLGDLFDF